MSQEITVLRFRLGPSACAKRCAGLIGDAAQPFRPRLPLTIIDTEIDALLNAIPGGGNGNGNGKGKK